MNIEVVLTETEIAEEFAEASEARDLPEKFFYWQPPAVRAWKALAHESGYFMDLNRVWKQIAGKIPVVVEHFGKQASVISFGAGDGLKDRLLLRSLRDAGFAAKYFPVDASQSLLEMAAAGAEDDDFDTAGIKADISYPVHLVFAADAAESPKLFMMAGNTLGGFDPLVEVQSLAESLHEGDRLIIDGEVHCQDTLERRENPAVKAWVRSPLAELGFSDEDGEIRFEQKHDERHAGLYMITRQFRAARDLRSTVLGREVLIEKGERLAMNFQYVYTPEAFRWLLEEHGGLKVLEEIRSPEGRFTAAICSR